MTTSTRATGIHHVSITVNDFERSRAFYTRLFELLGGQVAFEATGAPHRHEGCRMMLLGAPGLMLGVWEAAPEHRGRAFDRYSVGLHHFAIAVESRAAVDEIHRRLAESGVEILDAPAEYPYAPGYYAVFFSDPDGIKLELVHM